MIDASSPGRGLLVVFEGGEGSGKSTQTTRLASRRAGAIATRQPGGTAIGASIRSLCLDPPRDGEAVLSARAEALLMAADRAQHVAELIEPSLAAGMDVICDRYVGSSLAYQGVGRDLGVESVRELSSFAVNGVWPDVVFLLDVATEVGLARVGSDPDRLEQEGDAFHRRVRQAYLDLAAQDPTRWVVIDATAPPDAVAGLVDAEMSARFGWERS